MKKILGIVASKRNLGNCEIMVKEISSGLPFPHQLQLLRLPDFELRYCTACYRCLVGDQGCVLKDDLAQVLEAIIEADALILAAPTYLLGAHACLKVFIDRALSFYGLGERLWGKPAVAVGIAGMAGKEGGTQLDLERFLAVILAENRGTRILYGALPGEVMLSEENRNAAAGLAAALAGGAPEREEPCCPVCGGRTFRLLQGNQVRCMLCSHVGTLCQEGGSFRLAIEAGEHLILFDAQNARQHHGWLLGMKKLFRERQKELKEVTRTYEDRGSWIERSKRT